MFNTAANRRYLAGILFVLSFFLYSRTLNYEFVWDDERVHLTGNAAFMNNDISFFWEDKSGMYIPITYTTWNLIKQSSGRKKLSPKPFHLLNVIAHSINCILIFQLLLLLFKNQAGAFFGSLLFLLHPLQVESIAWISEFRGLYSAFFCLLSLLSLLSFLDKKEISSMRSLILSKHFILATFLFIMALLSKPSAAVLPVIAGILTWCFYRKKSADVSKALLTWILPVIVSVFFLMQKEAQGNVLLWQRFFVAGDSLFFYLCKLVIPYPLVAGYGFTPGIIAANKLSYITTLIIVTISIFLFRKRGSYPVLFSGFAIVFFCLLPLLGFISFDFQKYSNVADRYFYLAMFGVTLWIPLLINHIKKYNYLKLVFGSVFIVFLLLNIRQTDTWKDEFTLWDHTLRYYQNNSKVYYNRGVEYSKIGRFDKAIEDYSRSIAIQSDYIWAIANRANAYENTNELSAALADYQSCLNIDSTMGSIYYNRSCLYYRMGNIDASVRDAKKAESLHFAVHPKLKKALRKALKEQQINFHRPGPL